MNVSTIISNSLPRSQPLKDLVQENPQKIYKIYYLSVIFINKFDLLSGEVFLYNFRFHIVVYFVFPFLTCVQIK